jgi:hypothetical protein
MSSNLRSKSYFFKNQQYSREEYLEKIKEYDLASFSSREKLNEEFENLLKNNSIHRYVISERNVNSTGSLLFDCKNITKSFEVDKGENCKYIYGGIDMKDSMDIYHVGYNIELCYECQGCTRVPNCQFCHLCYDDLQVMYSDTCQNSQNLFGCVSVKKGEYMIFNKKYSKEEYLSLKEKIIEHMRETKEYGEFFPPSIAPVYYNETQGSLYDPLTKEEVLTKGWHWEENLPGTFGKGTIPCLDIPDSIKDIPDTYLNEIFTCTLCSKNYNVTRDEFSFYRKENIPFPRKCPNCRYKRRFDLRPMRKLWHRSCKCQNESHGHDSVCTNSFETPFSPDRPEKVYCESCYQKEVL